MNEYLVVRCDNYGRSGETPGYDEVFETNVPLPYLSAKQRATKLNRNDIVAGDDYYFRVVPAGYKLAKFEP